MNKDKTVLKVFLGEYANEMRKRRGLTQEEIAEELHITFRAYGDLERGKYCFSAKPLLFLLLMMNEEETKNFFERLCTILRI